MLCAFWKKREKGALPMFKTQKEPMRGEEVQPTWEYLVKQERRLKRNKTVCRIIQPVGSVLCLLGLLLASMNVLLYFAGDIIRPYFDKLPVLPSLVNGMPRGSLVSVILFTLLLVFIIPLAVGGIIAVIFYLIDWNKYKNTELPPLVGTPAQCARALTHKAETVYEMRKKIPRWTIYLETGILTVIMAIPIILMYVDYASAESPMVLTLVLIALALLICLFVVFWIYAALLQLFSLANSLFYYSDGQWKLYALYQRVDAYWESVDPVEFERRQNRAEEALKK